MALIGKLGKAWVYLLFALFICWNTPNTGFIVQQMQVGYLITDFFIL